MTTAPHNLFNNDNDGLPEARIEAEDAAWVVPLRELFERYGCRVVVNRNGTERPMYLIGVGNASFVKAFFESTKFDTAKKLAIVYEGDQDELAAQLTQGVKQYYIDPTPLSEKGAREICAFFFTGSAHYMNARKERPAVKKIGVMQHEVLREESLHRISTTTTTDDEHRIATQIESLYRKQHNKPPRRASRSHRWLAWVSLVLVIIVSPIVLYVLSISSSAVLLALSMKTIERGDNRWTQGLLAYSHTYIRLARGTLSVVTPLFIVARKVEVIEDQDRLLSIFSQISNVQSSVIGIFQTSKAIAGGIFIPYGTGRTVGVSDVLALTTEVSRVSQYLGLVSAELESLKQTRRFPFSAATVSLWTSRVITKLTTVRAVVRDTEKLLTLYPHIAGFRGKQTYLVLLQNSMELRPTGGFIGSVALLTFIDGKVESLEVEDVYTADGQLKGHVDPPRPIRELLGSEHWYLRDSNWDPDFRVSGEKALWFYEKEVGKKVDGVIALSLPIVMRLLRATGPIELLDFNDRITESNFFAKSLVYTEKDFFPGSTKKKDFLGSLTSALLTHITTDPSIPAGELLMLLREGLAARDLQFYFTDANLESLISQWGWHGGIGIDQCVQLYQDASCIGDGVAPIDANLGVNKSNFFVTRQALSEISIQENGDIQHTLTMSVQNSAPEVEHGAGAYVNYFRVFIPQDAQGVVVSIDGSDVPVRPATSVIPQPLPYWLREETGRYAVVHVPFTVPPRQARQLIISWTRKAQSEFDGAVVYQFNIRKQPGVAEFPWRIHIQYPARWSVVRENGVAKPGVLEYNTDLTKDASFRMLFQKN